MHMKRIIKLICLTLIISVVCVLMSSCISNRNKPDYLLMGAKDNGFVPSYRAYYAITGDTIKKIPQFKYENYIYKDDHYKSFNEEFSNYDVVADSPDPSEWNFELMYYDNEPYDTDALIKHLQDMNVSYMGNVYILVLWFDEYVIVEVTNLDDTNTVLGETFGLFRNGKMIDLPAGTDLSSIRTYYRYEQDAK